MIRLLTIPRTHLVHPVSWGGGLTPLYFNNMQYAMSQWTWKLRLIFLWYLITNIYIFGNTGNIPDSWYLYRIKKILVNTKMRTKFWKSGISHITSSFLKGMYGMNWEWNIMEKCFRIHLRYVTRFNDAKKLSAKSTFKIIHLGGYFLRIFSFNY